VGGKERKVEDRGRVYDFVDLILVIDSLEWFSKSLYLEKYTDLGFLTGLWCYEMTLGTL
jgi:hypothetical protein